MILSVLLLVRKNHQVLWITIPGVFIGMMNYRARRNWRSKTYCSNFIRKPPQVFHCFVPPSAFPLNVSRPDWPDPPFSNTSTDQKSPNNFFIRAIWIISQNIFQGFSRKITGADFVIRQGLYWQTCFHPNLPSRIPAHPIISKHFHILTHFGMKYKIFLLYGMVIFMI